MLNEKMTMQETGSNSRFKDLLRKMSGNRMLETELEGTQFHRVTEQYYYVIHDRESYPIFKNGLSLVYLKLYYHCLVKPAERLSKIKDKLIKSVGHFKKDYYRKHQRLEWRTTKRFYKFAVYVNKYHVIRRELEMGGV
jgi:hypothetical protein